MRTLCSPKENPGALREGTRSTAQPRYEHAGTAALCLCLLLDKLSGQLLILNHDQQQWWVTCLVTLLHVLLLDALDDFCTEFNHPFGSPSSTIWQCMTWVSKKKP